MNFTAITGFVQNRWLLLVLRLALGGIFITAGIAKLSNQAEFTNAVIGYGILPDSLARLYGSVLPWAELTIGFCLILGLFTRIASGLVLPAALSFVIANSYAIYRQFQDDCGCFGALVPMSYPVSLTVDILMLLMATVLLIGKERVKFLSVSALLSRISLPSMSKARFVLHRASELAIIAILVLAIGIPLHGGIAQSPIYAGIDNSLRAGKPALLYFYIDGCGDCELQKPIIDNLEQEYESKIGFVRVDYRAEADVVLRFDIHGTPNILLIADGRSDGEYDVYKRFSGLTDEETLRYFLTVVSNQPFNGAPSPSPTPSQAPTLTLEPTPTLSPTSTPMPIPTPEPTPMPTLELTPSPTLMPTSTPTAIPPPQADFVGSPTVCNGATTVSFTDLSTGEITSWSWDFGDGHTSTLQNPSNYYNYDGLYTVTLTATGPGGTDVETKSSYIYVQGCST